MKFGKGKGKNVLFVLIGVVLLLSVVYFVFSKKIYEGAETKRKAAGVTPTLEQCRPVFAEFQKEEQIKNTTNQLKTDLTNLFDQYPKNFARANNNWPNIQRHEANDKKVGSGIDSLLSQIDAFKKMNINIEKKTKFDGYYTKLTEIKGFARETKEEIQAVSVKFQSLADEINKSLLISKG